MKRRFLAPLAVIIIASLLIFCAAGVTQGHEGEDHDHEHDSDHSPKWVSDVPQGVVEQGMSAALTAMDQLDDSLPRQRATQEELIANVARCRGWPAELLRRYDKAGFKTFYTDEGLTIELRVGKRLTWEIWEANTTDVLVRAAPRPTLAWLAAQADLATPNADRVAMICRTWGTWARQGREQQYREDLGKTAARLLGNKTLRENPQAASAIVRLAGDVRAQTAAPAIAALAQNAESAVVRQASCAAMGRLEDSRLAPPVLTRVVETDRDPRVVDAAAAALDHWPNDARAGAALLAAFKKTNDSAARRSIAFTAIKARWPQRGELVSLTLADTDGSVVGVGLQAMAARVEPAARDAALDLATSFRSAQPNMVDALGAIGDPRSSAMLVKWTQAETNPALRAKLVVALRGVGDPIARRAILDLMRRDDSGLVVEQTILGVESLAIEEAVPFLLELVKDRTAPMGPRLQGLRALGRFGKPEVRRALESLWLEADKVFEPIAVGAPTATQPHPAVGPGVIDARQPLYERVEQARLYIAVAQLRLGEAAASARLQQVFDTCTATTQFHGLWLLGSLKLDHPAIARGLASDDLAVLMTAVRAASRTRPQIHVTALEKLDRSPWLAAMANSSMDTLKIRTLVREALEAAKQPATRP